MLVLAGVIVYRDFVPLAEHDGAPIPRGNITFFRGVDAQFMLAFPLLSCSFLCHFNVLPIYRCVHRSAVLLFCGCPMRVQRLVDSLCLRNYL